ncbi:MAG TPA: S9 family peptidase, partial [Cyclobacteriaceae bacterium]|nr:S9 family peptidase [Cyclobacteriaceae bacterium]
MRSGLLLLLLASHFAFSQHVPTFEEVISLRNITGVTLSPDGKTVAYTMQTADWNDNRFDIEIWLWREGAEPIQLTHSPRSSSTAPRFSPDGRWISFLSDRGNKSQVYLMRVDGGEPHAVTREEEGVFSYEWHPAGAQIIFAKPEREQKIKKEREKRYGSFEADDKEFPLTHLWQIEVKPDQIDPAELPCYETVDSLKVKTGCIQWPKAERLTEGGFTVTRFIVSPDGTRLAINHQPTSLINSFLQADISILTLADKKLTPLVTNASTDALEDWSPDSNEVLFTTNGTDTTSNFYTNSKLFSININTLTTRQLAKNMDEDLAGFTWTKTGIYSAAWFKTKRPLYRIDPVTGTHSIRMSAPEQIFNYAFSKDGSRIAFAGRNGDQLTEVFVSTIDNPQPRQITKLTNQITGWKVAQSEVISWRSKDGTTIEGVLHKPMNYDPSKKYPLLVVIHGGPTGIDTPTPVPSYVYPILQWLDKGCLVLRPNYRGSAGYGEAFRSLNVKNLGVGDMWDV